VPTDRSEPLPYSAACERNQGPILEHLREHFASVHDVLEIGSGTGQHAVYFARHLPHLRWQPTERPAALAMLRPRIEREAPPNVAAPLALEVGAACWPVTVADGVFTANTLHIMAWPLVEAAFVGLGRTLAPGGVLCVYGPFRYAGQHTSRSNAAFDAELKDRDPHSGIRDAEAVGNLARGIALTPRADYAMPANNRLLVFARPAEPPSR
jgi:SAM-dependent methyltransferase